MQTVMFHSTIFGPIHSRRLGTSLGVNLSPADGKVCSFDCAYCEAGLNAQGPGKAGLPDPAEVGRLLEEKLAGMKAAGERLDVITFSGNGEPTLHPRFAEVIDETIRLRDKYYPEVKISVLSNSTRLDRPAVAEALRKVDNNILKLDSAIDSTMRLIDRPTSPDYSVAKAVEGISQFPGGAIVQTMLLRGSIDGTPVDNTTPQEIDALTEAYKKINPAEIMIYSLDRPTPFRTLEKIPREELDAIGNRLRAEGFNVQVN